MLLFDFRNELHLRIVENAIKSFYVTLGEIFGTKFYLFLLRYVTF